MAFDFNPNRGVWALQKAIQIVEDRHADVEGLADKYLLKLDEALADMAAVKPSAGSLPSLPAVPDFDDIALHLDAAPQAPANLGDTVPEPNLSVDIDQWLSRLGAIADEPLPAAPTMPALAIPAPPSLAHVDAPARPAIDTTVVLPADPVLSWPDMGALRDIPDFAIADLPDFDGQPPTLNFVPPHVFIDWREPQYQSELYDDLVAQIKTWLAGGTGLPPAVEDALFWRARERDAEQTRAAVQEAMDTFAARGFTLPPGMLAKRVQVAQDKGREAAAALNRDILIEAAKWEIENLRNAVAQGIAMEGMTINLFSQMAARMFEVAKFSAESQITLFNARIGLYNAQLEGFRTLAQVFRTRLDAALAKLEVYKARVQAAGEYNRNAVDIFKARYEGVRQVVEAYKARMDGARVKADVIRALFDGWRTEVQAYGERLQAEKTKFDAYDSQVRAETAKAGLFEAQTRAYAATVQAVGTKADIKLKNMQMNIDAAKLALQKYGTDADVYGKRVQAMNQRTTAIVSLFSARVDAWRAKAQAVTSQAEVKARMAEATSRMRLSYAELQLGQYKLRQQKADLEAQLAMEAAKAAGQYAAQVAAGAWSAINVSASISGSGSQSGSDNTNRTQEYIYQNG